MRKTRFFCDRCHAEMVEVNGSYMGTATEIAGPDFCKRCATEYKEWVTMGGDATSGPRRYEKLPSA